MKVDSFEVLVNALKMISIFLLMVTLVPLLVWIERRVSAFIQNRLGPNRVGPLGLMQLLADAIKFLFKEEMIPNKSRKFIFYAAPVMALIPAALSLGALPLSLPIKVEAFQWLNQTWGPYLFPFQAFDLDAGVIFVLGISSLGAYSLLMAGWSSSSKYSLMGALRSSAQVISYELALSLSLVGILMIYGTFNFTEMIQKQSGVLNFIFLGKEFHFSYLPDWGIFYQPLGAFLFFVAVLAETNRLPFDLPEAESELVAGYHTEYGGLKMNMFYIGEYGHMIVASALITIFYFGGYHMPFHFLSPEFFFNFFTSQGYSMTLSSLFTSLILSSFFFAKVFCFLFLFIWVRWTLPRFRYDQLMQLGWKKLLPWSLGNTFVSAFLLLLARGMSFD